MLVKFIRKPSEPVKLYLSHMQSKVNGNQPLDWLTDIWLMAPAHGAAKSTWVITNKQKNQCSEAASMTVRLTIAGDNQAQGRKKKTLAGSHYFYTEESIPRTNFHAHLSLFACTLHAQLRPLHPCNIICEKKNFKKIWPLVMGGVWLLQG